jgi:uncharacterized protein (UPF0212 family)
VSVVEVGKGRCPYCGKELDGAEAYLHITTCPKRPRRVRVKYV